MRVPGRRAAQLRVPVIGLVACLTAVAGLLAGGLACLAGGVVLIAVPLRRACGQQYSRPGDARRRA
jgi:hypothetical protein